MADYDPILNALQRDLLGILILFTILGILHIVPSMVVAFVAAARTERTLWAELPRGSFWGWVLGVPIWVAVLVLLIGLLEMLLGNRIEKFRDPLYTGFGVIGFLAAICVQYQLVVHYFRSKIQDRLGWKLDEPRFQPPQRFFTFSLRKLLLAQVGLIFLFGLWVGARREAILKVYAGHSEWAKRIAQQQSLEARFGVHGFKIHRYGTKGIYLHHWQIKLVNFNDDVLRQITPADRLYKFDIQSHQLTDKGLEILSELENLEEMTIKSNLVTDAGVAHLKKLSKLRKIGFDCPLLTERALQELQEIETLELVCLYQSKISEQHELDFKERRPRTWLETSSSPSSP